jgi:hypothetical protein
LNYEVEIDVYVVDKSFSWTYVSTMKDGVDHIFAKEINKRWNYSDIK